MSWTDEEIDNLFKDGANAQSFKYDNSYFAEMEAASLPVNKKGKDFLWMGTALVFIAVLTTGYFVNDANTSFNNENSQLANLELNTTNENTKNSNVSNENGVSIGDQNESINTAESNDLNKDLSNSETSNTNSNSETSINGKSTNANSINSNTKSWNAKSPNGDSPNSMYNIATRNVGASRPNSLSNSNEPTGLGNSTGTTTGNLVDLRTDAKVSDQKQFTLQTAPITAGLVLNDVAQLDQGLNPSLSPNALPLLGQLRPKAALYFELNAGVSQSMITPSDVMSKSIGGGIGVETYLGNFNLTTGLNYKVSYHNDLFLTRKGKAYGFGSTAAEYTYDFKNIYSFELPVTLGYNFGKHNVNIGVRTSFVFGDKVSFQMIEEGQITRQGTEIGRVSREGEVVNSPGSPAILTLGVKPTFGYSYHMNKWTIGANIGVQLMNSVDEEFIDGFNNQFPIDGQVFLRRTIRLRR